MNPPQFLIGNFIQESNKILINDSNDITNGTSFDGSYESSKRSSLSGTELIFDNVTNGVYNVYSPNLPHDNFIEIIILHNLSDIDNCNWIKTGVLMCSKFKKIHIYDYEYSPVIFEMKIKNKLNSIKDDIEKIIINNVDSDNIFIKIVSGSSGADMCHGQLCSCIEQPFKISMNGIILSSFSNKNYDVYVFKNDTNIIGVRLVSQN